MSPRVLSPGSMPDGTRPSSAGVGGLPQSELEVLLSPLAIVVDVENVSDLSPRTGPNSRAPARIGLPRACNQLSLRA